jgi:hypothetical protein
VKLLGMAAVSRLKGGIADVMSTISRSVQSTETIFLEEQVQLLTCARYDLAVRRPFTVERIPTVLRLDTTPVRRQPEELKIAAANQPAKSLSQMRRPTQRNGRLKGEITSLKATIQRLSKSPYATQAQRTDARETIVQLQTECKSKDARI